MTNDSTFTLRHAGLLDVTFLETATHRLMIVVRSALMGADSVWLHPVREFLEDHPHELVCEFEVPAADMRGGHSVRDVYDIRKAA